MLLDFLELDAHSRVPVYVQLYAVLKQAVEQGRVVPGEKLPSVRRLAQDLSLSRTTVETAYQQLCVEGYIASKPQSGYYVLQANWRERRSPAADTVIPHKKSSPVLYDFGTDFIDSHAFHIKLWQKYIRDVLNQQELIASYGEYQGELELRQALTEYSHSVRGVAATADRIVVGAGTQPLLYLLSGYIRRTGSAIGIETPGFKQAEQVFADCGIPLCPLPGDREGIDMARLYQSGVRVVYVNPSNRLKTGTPIPMARRMELLEWASHTGGLILEDDHNGELRYNARPIPSMQGMGDGESVVYIGSFSKVLLPSVRMGYMVLPEKLAAEYAQSADSYHQTASKIEQLALARYIREGQLERQLRRLRKLYADKGNRLVEALQDTFENRIEITLQETALRLVVTVNGHWDGSQLEAMARAKGVRVTAFAENAVPGRIVLGFAGIAADKIAAGVDRLQEAWKETLTPPQ